MWHILHAKSLLYAHFIPFYTCLQIFHIFVRPLSPSGDTRPMLAYFPAKAVKYGSHITADAPHQSHARLTTDNCPQRRTPHCLPHFFSVHTLP